MLRNWNRKEEIEMDGQNNSGINGNVNQPVNNNNGDGQQSQNNNQNNQTVQQEGNQNQNNSNTNTPTKEEIIAEYIKGLGFDNEGALSDVVKKHNEDVAKNKTDLEKAQDEKTEALKRFNAEKERADLAEAKLLAVSMGVKKELVDDVVIIAKSMLKDGKKISDVIKELKESERGKIYFQTDDEGQQNTGTTNTRGNAGQQNNNSGQQNNSTGNKSIDIVNRLFSNKKQNKSHYFKNS